MRDRADKALRLIAGALIGSDLTRRDLIEISERLMFDRGWTERLSGFLREISQMMDFYRLESRSSLRFREAEVPEDLAEQLVDLFARKRLRKTEALRILKKVGMSIEWGPDPHRTLRENCTALISALPDSEAARSLVNRVSELLGYGSDPYLEALS